MKKEFTFHYGPIQIKNFKSQKYKTPSFTFHYGPIQIDD